MTNHNSQTRGSIVAFPDSTDLQAQASHWLAKLDAEQPSDNDLAQFKQWVNASPRHREAFEEIIEFWDEMNILTQTILPRELNSAQPQRQPWLARPAAALASLTLVLSIVVVLTLQWTSPQVYSTGIGEQQTIRLSDNSLVQLNTNSRLEVDYSNQRRRLVLTQGEAHFDVSHNPKRPFEVSAGHGLVRAIGTAFSVHVRTIDVEVIVTEGSIEVDRAPRPEVQARAALNTTDPVKASAGTMLTFDKQLLNNVEMTVAQQIDEQLSWRQGMLVFKGEPLQNVVDEVSRYTNLKIIIPERRTRELQVGGLFKVGDTESLFEALQDGFDIHVQEVSEDVVYLITQENR